MDEGGGMFTEELAAAGGSGINTELHGYDDLQHFPTASIDQTPLTTSIAELPFMEIFPPDPLVEQDYGLLPIPPSCQTSPMPRPDVNPERLRTISVRENEECVKGHGEHLGIAPKEKGAEVAGEHDRPRRKSRAAKSHNEAEKRRRGKMKTKMKELRELLPVSTKLDMNSTLDEAIKHLKSLQFQVYTLAMGCWASATPMAAFLFSQPWMQHLHQMGSMAPRINEGMQPEPGMASSCPPLAQSNSLSRAPALQWSHQPESLIPRTASTEPPHASTSSNPDIYMSGFGHEPRPYKGQI